MAALNGGCPFFISNATLYYYLRVSPPLDPRQQRIIPVPGVAHVSGPHLAGRSARAVGHVARCLPRGEPELAYYPQRPPGNGCMSGSRGADGACARHHAQQRHRATIMRWATECDMEVVE